MNQLKLFFCVLVPLITGCSSFFISSQAGEEFSAVTMYVELKSTILEEVEITNIKTGKKYSSKQNGFGKEYFMPTRAYSKIILDNVPSGNYYISRVEVWTIVKKKRVDLELVVPSDVCFFEVKPNDILYLGEITFLIMKSEEATANFNKLGKEINADKEILRSKVFNERVRLVENKYAAFENKTGYMHRYFPDGRKFLREGEREFLNYFISENFGGWSEIARNKINKKD